MFRRVAVGVLLSLMICAPAWAQRYCVTSELPARYWTAAFDGPMTYRLEVINRRRILIAEGEVKLGESARLATALDSNRPIDEVWLNSPGGAAAEGPKMGRILRARGLMVRLPAHFACISACSYAFLGGSVRVVDPGGYYGVHMFSITDPTMADSLIAGIAKALERQQANIAGGMTPRRAQAEFIRDVSAATRPWQQEAANMAADRARYLVEMSLSLDFMTDAFNTRHEDTCFLNREGIKRYNVDNTQ